MIGLWHQCRLVASDQIDPCRSTGSPPCLYREPAVLFTFCHFFLSLSFLCPPTFFFTLYSFVDLPFVEVFQLLCTLGDDLLLVIYLPLFLIDTHKQLAPMNPLFIHSVIKGQWFDYRFQWIQIESNSEKLVDNLVVCHLGTIRFDVFLRAVRHKSTAVLFWYAAGHRQTTNHNVYICMCVHLCPLCRGF